MWQNCRVVLAGLVLLSSPLSFAQQQPEVFKILGISVEGQTSAEPRAIIANTGLKVGDEISVPGEETRTAINRLHQLRLFSDIQILIENRVQDGVYLLIRVKENPRLDLIMITGNDELSEDDILKKINLTRGQLVTAQELSSIKRVLKHEYEQEGHLNATIETRITPSEDTASQRVVLSVIIDEGSVVMVGSINFFGNKDFDDGDLKSELKETSDPAWWQFWVSRKFKKKEYEKDKGFLIDFYRKNGYRDAEILADSLTYDDKREYLAVDIYLYEGPQYKVRNIVWQGNTVYTSEALTARLGFRLGDVYNREKFEQNLYRNQEESDVGSMYYDAGYLLFQAEPEEVPVAEDSVDIVIRVRERDKFRIGRVLISGNTKTYEKVVRRELYTRPGDYFSRQAIIGSIRQLSQLNYFNPETIKPDTRINVENNTVDIEYSMQEKSSDTFNMSVGYSGAFGFNGGLGLTFNNFSLTEPFRGGAGQILNFEWQFGEGNRYRTFTIGFTEPWMFDTPTLLGVNLFDTRVIYFDYDYRITGASLRIGRRLKWPDNLFRGDWTIRYQRNEVNTGGGFYSEGVSNQVGITQVISRNSVDSPIFPSRGSSFSLLTEISGGPFLPGSARYHKHVFNADWYIPIANSSRLALAFSTSYGFIFGFDKNSFIPIQDYFYMGGTGLGQFATTPLRGYDDRSVGPRQPTAFGNIGGIIGGRGQIKHSAELRFALALNPIPIYTLLFAEAGNVWAEPRVMDPMDLKRSAGMGVRLLINPIGLIGFDYGYGFDGIAPGEPPAGWRFHFQFGRSF
ncbi:MAG: outer membrane protein assembly factor BamA [Bacteroidota bacterium]